MALLRTRYMILTIPVSISDYGRQLWGLTRGVLEGKYHPESCNKFNSERQTTLTNFERHVKRCSRKFLRPRGCSRFAGAQFLPLCLEEEHSWTLDSDVEI